MVLDRNGHTRKSSRKMDGEEDVRFNGYVGMKPGYVLS